MLQFFEKKIAKRTTTPMFSKIKDEDDLRFRSKQRQLISHRLTPILGANKEPKFSFVQIIALFLPIAMNGTLKPSISLYIKIVLFLLTLVSNSNVERRITSFRFLFTVLWKCSCLIETKLKLFNINVRSIRL